jgi:hypothetical protein
MRFAFALVLAVGALSAQVTRTVHHHGEKVLRCALADPAALDIIVEKYQVDVWGSSQLGTIDIRVADMYEEKGVRAHLDDCVVAVEDVEALVSTWENEVNAAAGNSTGRHLLQTDWFSNYRSYAELVTWYQNFATANPSIIRWIPSIGSSFEGRAMPAIVVSNAAANAPSIYMQCLIHAREWISGATCNWVINQLVTDFNNGDATARNILNSVRIHLVLFTNPDGYEFTRSSNRLWRKARDTVPGSTCIGTDLNRNYNDNWGRGGSSTNPCTDTYMGRAPADTAEVRATSAYFREVAPVIGAIDWHAYSQLILRPYGWTNADSPHEVQLRTIGAAMADAIRGNSGLVYQNIKSIQLYVTTGTASDWFYGEDATRTNGGYRAAGYTIELRPTGANPGFQLPPAQIVPTGRENYEAFKQFATRIIAQPIRTN